MRPNIRFHDVDELMMAKVLQHYEQPMPRAGQSRATWDLISYWALAVLFTACITMVAS